MHIQMNWLLAEPSISFNSEFIEMENGMSSIQLFRMYK